MSLPLAAFQSDLCRALRGEALGPRAAATTASLNIESPGFLFTRHVRRTWCERRALAAARPVLALLPPAQRRQLVQDYVTAGGGLALFLPTETEAFLPYLESRLPDPSHALTICRLTLALARARAAAETFTPPDPPATSRRYTRRRDAALIWFHAPPAALTAAINGAAPGAAAPGAAAPPLGPPQHPLLIAPGLAPDFCRIASLEEAEFWQSLPAPAAPTALIARLLRDGAIDDSD